MQAEEAVDVAFADVDGTGIEDDVAGLCMGDGDSMDVGVKAEDKHVKAPTTAGVTVEKANMCASAMCKRAPTTTLVEISGCLIRHQLLPTRQKNKVEGLNALSPRTTKPNGRAWDY